MAAFSKLFSWKFKDNNYNDNRKGKTQIQIKQIK